MKIALFAYAFPHKKTQDFLYRLSLNNNLPTIVLAAEWSKLGVYQSKFGIKKCEDLFDSAIICQKLDIPYFVVKHNSNETIKLIKEYNIDLGIIAGARILKKEVIEACNGRVINFHHGILPGTAGLNALEWSIYNDLPPAVTAHFINADIDNGYLIKTVQIPVFLQDTIDRLYFRLYEAQNEILPDVIYLVDNKKPENFPILPKILPNPPLTEELENIIQAKFENYKKKFKKITY